MSYIYYKAELFPGGEAWSQAQLLFLSQATVRLVGLILRAFAAAPGLKAQGGREHTKGS